MSSDGADGSLSGGDGSDDLNPSMISDLFESFEKSFLSMELSKLSSVSEQATSLLVSRFVESVKRVILIGFTLLVVTTIGHLLNLIYLSPSAYSIYVFIGLIFFVGYLYPIRVIHGLFRNRAIFPYLKVRAKASVFLLSGSLVFATILGAYPVMKDYFHFFVDTPGTCLMLVESTDSTIYFDNVSCFTNKAFQVLDYKSDGAEECLNSDFGIYETWAGDFCLTEKRPPTEDELRIISN